MANIKSNQKSIIKNLKKTVINRSRLNNMKTFIKKFEESVKSGNKDIAKTNFILAESAIAKTSQKGTLPKNTASRKIAKLSAKLKALA